MKCTAKATQTAWIGLDVDIKNVVAAVDQPLAPGKPRVRPNQLPTKTFERSREGLEQMLAWAAGHAGGNVELRVVMESTGGYSEEVHTWLCKIAPQTAAAIMNPKIMKDFLQSLDPRTKSDRVDSQGIARFGTERTPDPTPLLSPAERKLRELMRVRGQLVGERDAMRNRLAATRERECQAVLESCIKHMQTKIELLTRKALKATRTDKRMAGDMARLMEILGVGEIVALTVLAEVGDLRRFKSAKQLAS